ncbi:MAG: glycoside hydrolase family 38 N-terminal domain-containing protein, partial [Candidatus Xenobia bacterium]
MLQTSPAAQREAAESPQGLAMQRYPDYTRGRLAQLATRMEALIYPETLAIEDLEVSPQVDRIPYEEARRLSYRPVRRGEAFGPTFATFWFRAKLRVPESWKDSRVDLLWNSWSEATIWVNGRTLQAVNAPVSLNGEGRPDAMLLEKAQGGETLELDIEMACNTLFGDAKGPYQSISRWVLDRCDIARFDGGAAQLYYDFLVLQKLEAEAERGLDPAWAGTLLFELNRFANAYDPDDRETWSPASGVLKALYEHRNASLTHELSAVGHAHIDTAWLWPIAETVRKCIRTFTTATSYMKRYPDYKFVASQAWQYDAVKRHNPDLYARMQQAAAHGQFVPVGGTWVEPDCNIPSGEAMVRQFLVGQRFFKQEFGRYCTEFWNPDVFGYNGQLPQIMQGAGIARFLTQKLSWNRFNKPCYHTFMWQGIDGSEVLAHFPPADTYNATCEIQELRENVKKYKDHDRSHHSYLLFGHGDGGGGPTVRMLEILQRVGDLEGLPRTRVRTPSEFFTRLEDDAQELPR